jgi:hypothetical protein
VDRYSGRSNLSLHNALFEIKNGPFENTRLSGLMAHTAAIGADSLLLSMNPNNNPEITRRFGGGGEIQGGC